MALVKSIAGNEICDTVARNAQVGGRNLLLNTAKPCSIKGTNSTNQCYTPYPISPSLGGKLPSGRVSFSVYVTYSGDSTAGRFVLQGSGPYWQNVTGTNTVNVKDIGSGIRLKGTTTIQAGKQDNNVQIRMDNVTGTITFSEMKFERGDKATDWTPALEDTLTMTDDNNGNVTISIL